MTFQLFLDTNRLIRLQRQDALQVSWSGSRFSFVSNDPAPIVTSKLGHFQLIKGVQLFSIVNMSQFFCPYAAIFCPSATKNVCGCTEDGCIWTAKL